MKLTKEQKNLIYHIYRTSAALNLQTLCKKTQKAELLRHLDLLHELTLNLTTALQNPDEDF